MFWKVSSSPQWSRSFFACASPYIWDFLIPTKLFKWWIKFTSETTYKRSLNWEMAKLPFYNNSQENRGKSIFWTKIVNRSILFGTENTLLFPKLATPFPCVNWRPMRKYLPKAKAIAFTDQAPVFRKRSNVNPWWNRSNPLNKLSFEKFRSLNNKE